MRATDLYAFTSEGMQGNYLPGKPGQGLGGFSKRLLKSTEDKRILSVLRQAFFLYLNHEWKIKRWNYENYDFL